MKAKILIAVIYSILLVSCGGSTSTPESSQSLIRKTLTIQSPAAYYDYACAAPSIQFVLPVILNDDSYQDFIIHYWCSAGAFWGEYLDTATPDALVALVSDGSGGYDVGNEDVFSQSFIGLGGASRKVVRRDINGDGFDDFAFAMNWEDGRLAAIADTNAAVQSLLISEAQHKYKVVRVGDPNWGHATGFISNADGTTDALFAGFTDGFHAYRYENDTFTPLVSIYPDEAGEWATGMIDIFNNGESEYIAASVTRYNDAQSSNDVGLRLYKPDQDA
jgi:hypothetical protein